MTEKVGLCYVASVLVRFIPYPLVWSQTPPQPTACTVLRPYLARVWAHIEVRAGLDGTGWLSVKQAVQYLDLLRREQLPSHLLPEEVPPTVAMPIGQRWLLQSYTVKRMNIRGNIGRQCLIEEQKTIKRKSLKRKLASQVWVSVKQKGGAQYSLNEHQWNDLGQIDCSECGENAIQMQSITSHTLSWSPKNTLLPLTYTHTVSLSHTHTDTQIYIAMVSVLDCELLYPEVIARLRDWTRQL